MARPVQFTRPLLAEFARQLTFVPAPRRIAQLENARRAYPHIDPDLEYPLEYIAYQITGYRIESGPEVNLSGTDIRADLPRLVEVVSASLPMPIEDLGIPMLTLEQLKQRWALSAKTIQRYRSRGLFAWRMRVRTNHRQLVFPVEAVQDFERSHPEQLERAAEFSRMSDEMCGALLRRARRIRRRRVVSAYQVAEHLANRTGRSAQAIRLMLLRHDGAHPGDAIFPEHHPPASPREQRRMMRLFMAGHPLRRIAKHYGRSRPACYRIMHQQRAMAIQQLVLRYVKHGTYDRPDAEDVIFSPQRQSSMETFSPMPASLQPAQNVWEQWMALPLPERTAEDNLFGQYHFCQYQIDQWRGQLDPQQPEARLMYCIETKWYATLRLRRLLLLSYFGHVMAVTAQHLSRNILPMQPEFLPFLSHGLQVLYQTMGSFDTERHRGFANYLKWHLMRRFARIDPAAMDPGTNASERHTSLRKLVDQLARRPAYQQKWETLLPEHRHVLEQQFGVWSASWDQSLRFGCGRGMDPVTLAQQTGEPLRRVIARRRGAMRQLRECMRTVDRHIDAETLATLCVSSLQRERPISKQV